MQEKKQYSFDIISYDVAVGFLLPRHYSGRKPQITIAFGAFDENQNLMAVCTFGKPASNSLCKGVCGEEFSSNVYELNRLCRVEEYEEPLSRFVSDCLKQLKYKNWIVVSYSDTDMNHNGYIYQACNFIYTGKTKARTDKYTPDNKHSRHYVNDKSQEVFRKFRSAKHRYIYFCASDKRIKKQWIKSLRYQTLPYPKEISLKYVLGDFKHDKIIKKGEK